MLGIGVVQAVVRDHAAPVRGHQLADRGLPRRPARHPPGGAARRDAAQAGRDRRGRRDRQQRPVAHRQRDGRPGPRSPARWCRSSSWRSCCCAPRSRSAWSCSSACRCCCSRSAPLLKPLQRRNLAQREMMGDLSNLATDIVSGLRVLRGIGGERVFHDRYARESQKVRDAGVEVGRLQSVLDAAQVGLPGLFVVVVVWLGARLAVTGQITVGELVAFYGYAAFLMIPLRTATEAINKWIRAFVAARRICRVLAPRARASGPRRTRRPRPRSGPTWSTSTAASASAHGLLTALVVRAARGLGARRRPARAVRRGRGPVGRRTPGPAAPRGRTPPHRRVRHRQHAVLRRRCARRSTCAAAATDALGAALHAASAEDVLEAVPARSATRWSPSAAGRSPAASVSGWCWPGRWRPTPRCCCSSSPPRRSTRTPRRGSPTGCAASARGRTTVVTTTSPLVLDRADEVVFLVDGRVLAVGTAPRPAARGPGVPQRRDPRRRRRGGGEDMTATTVPADQPADDDTVLPVATDRQVARVPPRAARRHPRLIGADARRCTRWPRWPGSSRPRLLGDIVEAVQTGTTTGHVDVLAGDHRGRARRPDRADPLGALPLASCFGEKVLAELRENFVATPSRCRSASSSPPAAATC